MQNNRKNNTKSALTVQEMTIFAMLGAIMFCSKIITEALPNIHLLGMLIMSYTIAFRKKALLPIYVFVLLQGLFSGFATWWLPYLYIWTILWAVTMLLPKNMPKTAKYIVYPLVCSLHGFAFGILYAPAQALLFGLDFEQTIAWIIAGFPWDITHGVSNLIAGLLTPTLSALLITLKSKQHA